MTRRSMTWGVLPEPDEFDAAWEAEIGDGDYRIREGAASGSLPEGVCSGDYGRSQVWEMLEWLTADASLGGEYDPGGRKGDLASCVLQTLGFEWI